MVKEVMDELALARFPKTSGATGLHILDQPGVHFRQVRDFAKELAKEVERRIDDQAVASTAWKVADRVGVFARWPPASRRSSRWRRCATGSIGSAGMWRKKVSIVSRFEKLGLEAPSR